MRHVDESDLFHRAVGVDRCQAVAGRGHDLGYRRLAELPGQQDEVTAGGRDAVERGSAGASLRRSRSLTSERATSARADGEPSSSMFP